MKFEKDSEYIKPLVDSNGFHYDEMPDGTISFGDVARNLLGEQAQYASRCIEGSPDGSPALGGGLKFSNLSSDYHSIGIHPDDIEEFRRRYESYRAYRNGYVKSPNGDIVELDDVALEIIYSYLEKMGVFSK